MDNKKIMTIAIVAVIIVGGGAFYGGTLYEKNSLSSQGLLRGAGGASLAGGPGGAAGQGRRMGPGAGANGGGFVTGQVIAQDSTSVTVKATDGSSKIIFYSGSTTIGKTVPGAASDLTTGEQIRVYGTANPDGSLAAQNIQILPAQQPQQPGQ